jgi:hypothetical protein
MSRSPGGWVETEIRPAREFSEKTKLEIAAGQRQVRKHLRAETMRLFSDLYNCDVHYVAATDEMHVYVGNTLVWKEDVGVFPTDLCTAHVALAIEAGVK